MTLQEFFDADTVTTADIYTASTELAQLVEEANPSSDLTATKDGQPYVAQAATLAYLGLSGQNLDEAPDHWLHCVFLAARKAANLVGNEFAKGKLKLKLK